MSSAAPNDLSTLQRHAHDVNTVVVSDTTNSDFLSDISPKHRPWDQHRGETDDVAHVFASSPFARHHRYAERLRECSRFIGFARDPPKNGKQQLKLKDARFCRVRYCPTCQWRRSLMWQARIHRALPHLVADFPQVRFLFATFTVKNCDVHLLRFTLNEMRKAWKRLIELQVFPAIGWVRSMEITRGRDGGAHPHFHSLLMVQPEYFTTGYLKQPEWAELWKQCLRITYKPVVDIRVVDPQYEPWRRTDVMTEHPVWNAAAEILKYSVKVSDMLKDDEWFLTVSDEVWKIRAVAVGGVLRKYLKDRDREDLFEEPGEPGAGPSAEEQRRLYFGWKQLMRRYRKVQ
jgi:plasmid rolling circle replication initiator protein Rep